MRRDLSIMLVLGLSFFCQPSFSQDGVKKISFDFYGDSLRVFPDASSLVSFTAPLSENSIQSFYETLSRSQYLPIVDALKQYKEKHRPDDWLYYQLIRKMAQSISPKAENYYRYTLYKWFFLVQSGYNAILTVSKDKLLFYVQSEENIYNIPSRISDGKQFICLNYHDYANIDFEKDRFTEVKIDIGQEGQPFSYKVTRLPDFDPANYLEKDISFKYYQDEYHFRVKINPQVRTIFANYPVVDYSYYLNIPLSNETYRTLIPLLKRNVSGMNKKRGVDYLMRFTRYAFLFERDSENFGKEKRLSPEETLLYKYSDCEDRAALFFYLVKEIYNLPMIVVVYPQHVTIAVQFDKPVGKPIIYNGKKYSICEPTPQGQDLRLGQAIPALNKTAYEVAYVYTPTEKK